MEHNDKLPRNDFVVICVIFCFYIVIGSQGQNERLDAMAKLKEFKCRILISTDLVSRSAILYVLMQSRMQPRKPWSLYLRGLRPVYKDTGLRGYLEWWIPAQVARIENTRTAQG